VDALGLVFGERVTPANGQRAAGADNLALGDEAIAAGRASKLTLDSTLSTSASAGISVSAA
jgi:hypothetical protein